MSPDKQAIQILLKTYWSSKGWNQKPSISPKDLEYCKAAGVMFEPLTLSHDELVSKAKKAVSRVCKDIVVNAFLASMDSRRLDLRSGLGSFAVLQFLKKHRISASGSNPCEVCGQYASDDIDFNVLNFERFKWGGVRHQDLIYAAFDLDLLAKTDIPDATAQDRDIFRKVIDTIRNVPPKTTSAKLEKHLANVIKSNKSEREILIGLLGFTGILETKEHSGFGDRYINFVDRDIPDRHFADMAYPACWWTSHDGINEKALANYFPFV